MIARHDAPMTGAVLAEVAVDGYRRWLSIRLGDPHPCEVATEYVSHAPIAHAARLRLRRHMEEAISEGVSRENAAADMVEEAAELVEEAVLA